MESEKDLFLDNDRRVLDSLTGVMRWLWLAFPFVYIGNLSGVFQIDFFKLNALGLVSLVILFLPTLAQKTGVPYSLRRYICVIGLALVVALLATNANIGIYMTYALAMVTSLLFFDPIFTMKISGISYILIVISLYFRSFEANRGEFATDSAWWLSRSLGFAIEAACMTAVCTVIARFSHTILKNLDEARKEAREAEERAKHSEELKIARDEAERARAAAEKANRVKSEFLSNMSHEIRTPLNAIMGMDDMILKESREANIRGYAGHIKKAGAHLISMVDNLMDFSEADAQEIKVEELRSADNQAVRNMSEGNNEIKPLQKDKEDLPEKKSWGFKLNLRHIVLIIIGIATNYAGRYIADLFDLPLWLDSVGTFVTAILLGPLAGAICGGLSNVLLGLSGTVSLYYAVVNISIGLSVGYFFPRKRTKDAFLIISTAVLSGLIAVLLSTPLNMIFYNGYTGNIWGDGLVDMLSVRINIKLVCSFLGEAFVDIPDKTLSVLIATWIIRMLQWIQSKDITKKNKAAVFIILPFILTQFFAFDSSADGKDADYSAEYESTIYDTADGLAAMEINAIAQTPDGYIWVGTYSGIYRYDGSRFELMNVDEHIRNVMALYIDSSGKMWIGTNDSGIACFLPDSGEISFYTTEDGLAGNAIRNICEDDEGRIYVGTSGYLSVIDTDGTVTTHNDWDDINYIRALSYGDGLVSGVTNGGVFFFIDKGRLVYHGRCAEDGVYYSSVSCGNGGEFIVGTSTGLIQKIRFEQGDIRITKEIYTGNISYCNMIRYYESRGGCFVCDENGMGFISDNGKFIDMTKQSFENSVSDVLMDYQENIWFVSNKQGVIKFSLNPFVDLFKKAGMRESVVNALLIRDDDLFVGMDDGLKIIGVGDNKIKKYDDLDLSRFDGVRIRNIYKDSKGDLWVSTYGQDGLVCIAPDNSMISYNEKNAGTLGGRFRQTIELHDGTILATSNVGMNFIRDGKIIGTLGESDGLKTPQILSMVEKPDGTVLAGSDGDGIYVIKDMKVLDHIGLDEGLETLVVLRIVPYRDGYFYVTSNSLYYHGADGIKRLESFPYSNNYDIYISEDNEAWVSSSAGIFVVNADELVWDRGYSYTLLNHSRGFSTSLTANAWNVAWNDTLLLCCNDGVRCVSTGDHNNIGSDYQIRISAVICDGTEAVIEEGAYCIPSNTMRVQIQPAVLNYTLSNPLIYIYLEGMEDPGLYLHQNELTNVVYTNLTQGDYVLHVQILDESSKEVLKEECFSFVKDSQIFERRGFQIYLFLVCVTFIAFLAWLIAKLGNMALINRQYEEINRAREDAELANRTKSDFLANMSHEIRTPINAVLGMNELILKEAGDDKIKEYAGYIDRAGHTLLSLINDILDFSRIEAGHFDIEETRYSLGEMIADVEGMTEMNALNKGLDFKVNMDRTLPDKLWGDDKSIRQILINLLTNAVKYTRNGGVELNVKMLSRDADMIGLEFEVKDSGIGIRKEDISKLFEGFERLDPTRNRGIQGTGLGLSITKSLVEQMGGELSVESVYGVGSRFKVSVTQRVLSEEAVGDYRSHIITEKPEAADIYAPDAKVLVVDDTQMNLIVFEERLKNTHISVTEAVSGLECLEAVKKQHFDVIFLDHFMPGMDGLETFARLKDMGDENLNKDTPVIALTANAIAGSKEMYLKAGFSDYLSKPVEYADLLKLLKKYIHQYEEVGAEKDTALKKTAKSKDQAVKDDNGELINIEEGLKYASGRKEFYKKLLTVYHEQGEGKIGEIEKALKENDIKTYVILVHALKSNSRMIGATGLGELAYASEMAGRDNDADKVRAAHDKLVKEYRRVLAKANDLINNM